MATPHPLHGDPDVLEVSVPVATVWTGPEAPRDAPHSASRTVSTKLPVFA